MMSSIDMPERIGRQTKSEFGSLSEYMSRFRRMPNCA